jgi:glycosyltransferase involved in cell wall biosynthesis
MLPLPRAGEGWGEGMRIAFYAPLKSPQHPIPSGDRLIARTFVAALQRAGHEVSLAACLRTWDGTGDARRQQRLARIGRTLAGRLVERWRRDPSGRPDLWFTYHVYHKAPDWTGPAVSAALDIAYIVAEPSVAQKQREGRWCEGHAAAVAAIRDADEVICINPTDVPGVAAVRAQRAPPVQLKPFFDVDAFAADERTDAAPGAQPMGLDLPRDSPRLVAVAMMRPDNKLASYRALAAALARLVHRPWHLVVVGDGEAREEVRTAFAAFGPGRVHFAGTQPRAAIAGLLGTCDLFVWPAVDEVIGMGLLEAQACGVPVIAARGPGVASVVADGTSGLLVPAGDEAAFADALEALITDTTRRHEMAIQARRYVRAEHALPAAAGVLDAIVARAVRQRKGVPAS